MGNIIADEKEREKVEALVSLLSKLPAEHRNIEFLNLLLETYIYTISLFTHLKANANDTQ